MKKVSIIPRGVTALGDTLQVPTEDRYILRQSELFERLEASVGDRVAEEIVFSEMSTGAENDLDHATSLARRMIVRYGISPALGLATFGDEDEYGAPIMQPRQSTRCSERTAELIEAEVRRLLSDANERVFRTLKEKQQVLDKIARALLTHEVVDHATLRLIMDDNILEKSDGPRDATPAATIIEID